MRIGVGKEEGGVKREGGDIIGEGKEKEEEEEEGTYNFSAFGGEVENSFFGVGIGVSQ